MTVSTGCPGCPAPAGGCCYHCHDEIHHYVPTVTNRSLLEAAVTRLEAAYRRQENDHLRHGPRHVDFIDMTDNNGHLIHMGHLSAIVIGRAALERS